MHEQIKSALKCEQCNQESVIFDPFQLFCVEIPKEKDQDFEITFLSQKFEDSIYKLEITLLTHQNKEDLKEIFLKKVQIENKENILFISRNQKNNFETYQVLEKFPPKQKKIYIQAYEIQSQKQNIFRTFIQFQNQPELLNNDLQNLKDLLDYQEIIDLQIDQYPIFDQVINSKFFSCLEEEEKESLLNEYIEIFLVAENVQNSIIYQINQEQLSQNKWQKQTQVCVFCSSQKCENGHQISQNSSEKILDFLQKGIFRLKVIFCKTNINLDVNFEKRKIISINKIKLPKDVNKFTLYDCFRAFQLEEYLEGVNTFKCKTCQIQQNGIKRLELYKVPEIFIVYIKRFKQGNYNDYIIEKNDTEVLYEEEMDLKDFLPKNYPKSKYELYAVNIHIGTVRAGQYLAYAKVDQKWYSFEDNSVNIIQNVQSSNAYALYYQRKKQN